MHGNRNKAVLNTSPDLPLLFLLIQLILAVVLLHGSALLTPRVEIPKLDAHTAYKLTPVILVNIIGLVFNTLCLRDVEASFFQVCRDVHRATIPCILTFVDCARNGPPSHHPCVLNAHALDSYGTSVSSIGTCHSRIPIWCGAHWR